MSKRINQTWEPLKEETDIAYKAFRVYLDAAYPEGPGGPWVPRKLYLVAEELGIQAHTAAQWSSRHFWRSRARDYDVFIDRQARDASIRELKATKRAQVRRLMKLADHLEDQLELHIQRGEALAEQTDGAVTAVTMKELIRGLDLVLKGERLIAGESTENVANQSNEKAWDLSTATLEELEQIEALRAKYSGNEKP